MSNRWWIIILITALCTMPASGQDKSGAASSESTTELLLNWQEDLKTKNFESAWGKMSSRFQKKFNNNIEEFKVFMESFPRQGLASGAKISGEISLPGDRKALLIMDPSGVAKDAYYLVRENETWKVDLRVRILLEKTGNDMARLATAIRSFYGAEKRFPQSLSELVPAYISDVPQDQFGTTPYQYAIRPYGAILYSNGPDYKDNSGVTEYFIDNGILSRGDIIMRITQ